MKALTFLRALFFFNDVISEWLCIYAIVEGEGTLYVLRLSKTAKDRIKVSVSCFLANCCLEMTHNG